MALPKPKLRYRIHDAIYYRTKKSRYITRRDLDSLHSMSLKLYDDLCSKAHAMHVVQPELYVVTDAHYRIWEINGPSSLFDEDEIYMYCIYHYRLQFEDELIEDMPDWYAPVSPEENLEPTGTCFKVKVDEII